MEHEYSSGWKCHSVGPARLPHPILHVPTVCPSKIFTRVRQRNFVTIIPLSLGFLLWQAVSD